MVSINGTQSCQMRGKLELKKKITHCEEAQCEQMGMELLALLLDLCCQSKSEIFAEQSVANEQRWQDQAWGGEGTWTSGLNQEPRAWAEPHESNCSAPLLSWSVLTLLPAKVWGSISWGVCCQPRSCSALAWMSLGCFVWPGGIQPWCVPKQSAAPQFVLSFSGIKIRRLADCVL